MVLPVFRLALAQPGCFSAPELQFSLVMLIGEVSD